MGNDKNQRAFGFWGRQNPSILSESFFQCHVLQRVQAIWGLSRITLDFADGRQQAFLALLHGEGKASILLCMEGYRMCCPFEIEFTWSFGF